VLSPVSAGSSLHPTRSASVYTIAARWRRLSVAKRFAENGPRGAARRPSFSRYSRFWATCSRPRCSLEMALVPKLRSAAEADEGRSGACEIKLSVGSSSKPARIDQDLAVCSAHPRHCRSIRRRRLRPRARRGIASSRSRNTGHPERNMYISQGARRGAIRPTDAPGHWYSPLFQRQPARLVRRAV
jgi:hypothetical protein